MGIIRWDQFNARISNKLRENDYVYIGDMLSVLLSCMQSSRLENQLIDRPTYIHIRSCLRQIEAELLRQTEENE